MNINEKYYDGFEGEEEIVFRLYLSGNQVEQIGIWGCYFNSIMNLISPSENEWFGLAYYYHLCKGWYEKENWIVPNLNFNFNQLLCIDKKLLTTIEEQEVLDLILKLFKKAIDDNNGEISISSY